MGKQARLRLFVAVNTYTNVIHRVWGGATSCGSTSIRHLSEITTVQEGERLHGVLCTACFQYVTTN